MTVAAILSPVFVQIGLTFFMLFWTARTRFIALRSGEVKVRDIALRERNWPQKSLQVANSFHNQLELPTLFFVLVALALITRKADLAFVVMSWLFVASRLVHAYIHTTSNKVLRRFQAFVVGVTILLLMWILFAVRVFFADVGVA